MGFEGIVGDMQGIEVDTQVVVLDSCQEQVG